MRYRLHISDSINSKVERDTHLCRHSAAFPVCSWKDWLQVTSQIWQMTMTTLPLPVVAAVHSYETWAQPAFAGVLRPAPPPSPARPPQSPALPEHLRRNGDTRTRSTDDLAHLPWFTFSLNCVIIFTWHGQKGENKNLRFSNHFYVQ